MKLGQIVGLLVIIICLYILWEIRQLLLLVFAAIVFATSLNQLVRWLTKKLKLPRFWSVILSLILFFAVTIGFFFLIVPPFIAQSQELIELFPRAIDIWSTRIRQLINDLPPWLNQYIPRPNINTKIFRPSQQLIQQLQPFVQSLVGGAGVFVSNTLGMILSFLFVLVVSIMMLAQPLAYRKIFVRLFPSFYRRRVEEILNECEVALGKWVIGAIISMTLVALLSFVGLSIIGVRLALAQGVLAGLLNFIPNIGPTLSVVLPMGVALLDSPWKSLLVLILYIFIQQLESNFITPYVMAQQVSLLPAITLISQVLFATFFGFLGLVLALPITVVGKVWIKEVLIKDVLDEWEKKKEDRTTKVVIIPTDSPKEELPVENINLKEDDRNIEDRES
ncbi:AI-2E family transporter [Aerosakkonemataceae cyanobacterium BLCC-F154]|uniref:AI-2E family transporter n=1 Tax=Floridaenema fluviatile BLCC-F154 TaxID=3153640 RepID=A0ABV4YG04_9CYAN